MVLQGWSRNSNCIRQGPALGFVLVTPRVLWHWTAASTATFIKQRDTKCFHSRGLGQVWNACVLYMKNYLYLKMHQVSPSVNLYHFILKRGHNNLRFLISQCVQKWLLYHLHQEWVAGLLYRGTFHLPVVTSTQSEGAARDWDLSLHFKMQLFPACSRVNPSSAALQHPQLTHPPSLWLLTADTDLLGDSPAGDGSSQRSASPRAGTALSLQSGLGFCT